MDLSELSVKIKAGMVAGTYKTIRLFGGEWGVPKDAKFITVDKDGDVHIWEAAPSTDYIPWHEGWYAAEPDDTLKYYLGYLGTIEMKPEYNWKEMIMEV